jgi:hypothetical protein
MESGDHLTEIKSNLVSSIVITSTYQLRMCKFWISFVIQVQGTTYVNSNCKRSTPTTYCLCFSVQM